MREYLLKESHMRMMVIMMDRMDMSYVMSTVNNHQIQKKDIF